MDVAHLVKLMGENALAEVHEFTIGLDRIAFAVWNAFAAINGNGKTVNSAPARSICRRSSHRGLPLQFQKGQMRSSIAGIVF